MNQNVIHRHIQIAGGSILVTGKTYVNNLVKNVFWCSIDVRFTNGIPQNKILNIYLFYI